MAHAQSHRGPDGLGYALWSPAVASAPLTWYGEASVPPPSPDFPVELALIHNWLAIMDPHPTARQPMVSADERYWLCYNGEIYNFEELRAELVAQGVRFRTASDTEVLLALWEREGTPALANLRGMFAFLVYDRATRRLTAVRDRFGIKPLYYAELSDHSGIVLASEFRTLFASGLVQRQWNNQAVRAFLAAGVNKPGDETTFFEGVHELPPGCLLEIRAGHIEQTRYYNLPAVTDVLTGEAALETLRAAFEQTVRLHLRSAREVGTCMSGGLDSTNLASAICHALGPNVSNFKAFTFGNRQEPDTELALQVGKQFHFQHDLLPAPATNALGDLIGMIVACETPNHTWGPINQFLLLRHIAQTHHIHVLLDGQGADEVFMGYPWFFPFLERYVRGTQGDTAANALQAQHARYAPSDALTLENYYSTFQSAPSWVASMDGGALYALRVEPDEVLGWQATRYYAGETSSLGEFREREFYRRELQFLLRQEDRLGMWFGIECRVPFLDHPLVETTGTIAPDFLVHEGYLKYPLRALYPEIPPAVRFNTAKRGFWENYSALPWFQSVAEYAVRYSDGMQNWMPDRRAIYGMEQRALWRFFQIAVLDRVYARDGLDAWVQDLSREAADYDRRMRSIPERLKNQGRHLRRVLFPTP